MTKQQRGTNGTETNHLPDVGNMVAQPELPCLTNEQIQDAVLASGGLEYQYQCVALTQRDQDKVRMDKRIAQLQAMVLEQAKTLTTRNQCIAELERELKRANDRAEVATGAYNTIYEREASLKEQLAVFMDKIPEGKMCSGCGFTDGFICGLNNEILAIEASWPFPGSITYTRVKRPSCPKAPGCPVTAEEEEK